MIIKDWNYLSTLAAMHLRKTNFKTQWGSKCYEDSGVGHTLGELGGGGIGYITSWHGYITVSLMGPGKMEKDGRAALPTNLG